MAVNGLRRAPTALPMLLAGPRRTPELLAIGCSTGGPNALFSLIGSLSPRIGVPVVITQHMPAAFITLLAQRLDRLGVLPCREASHGAPLVTGEILLAPGDRHLMVRAGGTGLRAGGTGLRAGGIGLCAELSLSRPENFCRPSIDPMLRSAAEATGGRVLAVILTGMGTDGVAGTRRIVEQGGAVIVQDEATSVVWGMPGAVARAGLAHAVLPLPRIGPRILAMLGVRP